MQPEVYGPPSPNQIQRIQFSSPIRRPQTPNNRRPQRRERRPRNANVSNFKLPKFQKALNPLTGIEYSSIGWAMAQDRMANYKKFGLISKLYRQQKPKDPNDPFKEFKLLNKSADKTNYGPKVSSSTSSRIKDIEQEQNSKTQQLYVTQKNNAKVAGTEASFTLKNFDEDKTVTLNPIHSKILRKYSRHFGIKEPYKVIVGPYFAQYTVDKKLNPEKAFNAIFAKKTKYIMYTTRCCIEELQGHIDRNQNSDGKAAKSKLHKFSGGAHILRKRCKLLPCLHGYGKKMRNKKGKKRWQCIPVMNCLNSYIKQKRYCFAVQPVASLSRARSHPGVPTIWIKDQTFVLDKLSTASLAEIEIEKLGNGLNAEGMESESENEEDTMAFLEDTEDAEDGGDGSDDEKDSNDGNDWSDDEDEDEKTFNSNSDDFKEDQLMELNHQQIEQNGNDSNEQQSHRQNKKSKIKINKSNPNPKESRKRTFETMNGRMRLTQNGGFVMEGVSMRKRVRRTRKRGKKTKETEDDDIFVPVSAKRQKEMDLELKLAKQRLRQQKAFVNWWDEGILEDTKEKLVTIDDLKALKNERENKIVENKLMTPQLKAIYKKYYGESNNDI